MFDDSYQGNLNDVLQSLGEHGTPTTVTTSASEPTQQTAKPNKKTKQPKTPKPQRTLTNDDKSSQWMSKAIFSTWLPMTVVGFCGLRLGLTIFAASYPVFQFAGIVLALGIFGVIAYNRFTPSQLLGVIGLQSLSGLVLGEILFNLLKFLFSLI